VKIKELVQSVKDSTPALAGIPDGKAVALLRAAFQQISAEIESTAEGVVKVGGLGQFRVRQVEREQGQGRGERGVDARRTGTCTPAFAGVQVRIRAFSGVL
jgi:nucleoid DNA-binding protein